MDTSVKESAKRKALFDLLIGVTKQVSLSSLNTAASMLGYVHKSGNQVRILIKDEELLHENFKTQQLVFSNCPMKLYVVNNIKYFVNL